MRDIQKIMLDFKIIAHRGCWDYKGAPENSLRAIKRAADLGFGIELDVHLLKDGTVAVFHDSSLKRMCFKIGIIENLTKSDLKNCRLQFTKETIPTFDEVLSAVSGRVPIFVELKCRENDITLVDALIKLTENYEGDLVFIGFSQKAGEYLKKKGRLVGYSCFRPPLPPLPYEADCVIGHVYGAPKDKTEREKYPPFVTWTISTKRQRRMAETYSSAAMYNTKHFKHFRGKQNEHTV